jgi:manganese efflux pump family protein
VIEALLLAIGLSMDASAVAAARGASARSLASRDLWILPLLFGAFQAGMSAIGWRGASWSAKYIDSWDHWLAFALLVGIGAKMLRDGLRAGGADEGDVVAAPKAPSLVMDLSLAVATSLDAAAAGVSLPSIPMDPVITVALIGGVTAALSALGFVIGCKVGDRIGRVATAFGGVVLIGIGVKLLWSALSAG